MHIMSIMAIRQRHTLSNPLSYIFWDYSRIYNSVGWTWARGLSLHRETDWSRIRRWFVCEICKFWSFLQSKSVNNVMQTASTSVPQWPPHHWEASIPGPLGYSPLNENSCRRHFWYPRHSRSLSAKRRTNETTITCEMASTAGSLRSQS